MRDAAEGGGCPSFWLAHLGGGLQRDGLDCWGKWGWGKVPREHPREMSRVYRSLKLGGTCWTGDVDQGSSAHRRRLRPQHGRPISGRLRGPADMGGGGAS